MGWDGLAHYVQHRLLSWKSYGQAITNCITFVMKQVDKLNAKETSLVFLGKNNRYNYETEVNCANGAVANEYKCTKSMQCKSEQFKM